MLSLTGSSLSIVPGVYVPFALAPFRPRHFLHAVNFRNTELGIESKVHFPRLDGQVAVVPVPQLLQVLVVQDIEGVVPEAQKSTLVQLLCPWYPCNLLVPSDTGPLCHVCGWITHFPLPTRKLLVDAT